MTSTGVHPQTSGPLAKKLEEPFYGLSRPIRWRSGLGNINRIIACQERGATLRETANALGIPVEFIRSEITAWLGKP